MCVCLCACICLYTYVHVASFDYIVEMCKALAISLLSSHDSSIQPALCTCINDFSETVAMVTVNPWDGVALQVPKGVH